MELSKAWSPCFSSWGGVEPPLGRPLDPVEVNSSESESQVFGTRSQIGSNPPWVDMRRGDEGEVSLRRRITVDSETGLSQRIQRISGRWTGIMSRRHVWIRRQLHRTWWLLWSLICVTTWAIGRHPDQPPGGWCWWSQFPEPFHGPGMRRIHQRGIPLSNPQLQFRHQSDIGGQIFTRGAIQSQFAGQQVCCID